MTQKEYENKRINAVENFITGLTNDNVVTLHNVYCIKCNNPADTILLNDECTFNETMGRMYAFDLARELDGDDYNTSHDYFVHGIYGLYSFNDPYDENSPLHIGDILSIGVDEVIDLLDGANIKHWDLDDELEELKMEFNKCQFKEQWDKLIESKSPMFTFPNGDYCYINYDEEAEILVTGSVCNAGFCLDSRSVSADVDYDETLDYNLDGLYDAMTDNNPELLEEPEEK